MSTNTNTTHAAKTIILPHMKGIIRVGALGYLKSNGGSYSAFTATHRRLGDAVQFNDAAALVRAS